MRNLQCSSRVGGRMQHTGYEAGLLMLGDSELQYMHNEHDQ